MPDPDPLEIFAANLRRLRKARGWSQEDLAFASNLNTSHVAKIERKERDPRARSVSKLCKGLEISAADLFKGIDGRKETPPDPDRPPT